MLTYLKIGIITELICMVVFLGVVLLLRIVTGKESTKEYLDGFDIGTVVIDTIATILIWPAVIPLKMLGIVSGLKN